MCGNTVFRAERYHLLEFYVLYSFTYCLFNDPVFISDFIASNDGFFYRGHPVVLIIKLQVYIHIFYFQSEHNNIFGIYNVYYL